MKPTRPHLHIAASGKPAPVRPQASWSNAPDHRRRARPEPHVFRATFQEDWARFCRANFRNANAVALAFEVTFQTALNWLDGGICRPSGDKVAYAALMWPEAFAAHVGRGV